MVVASSSSVYGSAGRRPHREDDPLAPGSPYAASKVEVERLAAGRAVVLRYFSVYGPRQRPDMAFHRFIRAAVRGESIVLYGDGEQTRDFTYVGDAVSATIAAAERGLPGRAYNIGGGSRVSMNDVIKMIERIAGVLNGA